MEKKSYEGCVNESVDDKKLSWDISKIIDEKNHFFSLYTLVWNHLELLTLYDLGERISSVWPKFRF